MGKKIEIVEGVIDDHENNRQASQLINKGVAHFHRTSIMPFPTIVAKYDSKKSSCQRLFSRATIGE